MEFGLGQFGWLTLAAGAAAFFVGGTVKGVVGLGLPLFTVPILATAMDPKVAVAMMSVPVLSSNLLLIARGGQVRATLVRFWSLLVMLVACTLIAAQFFVTIDASVASILLGTAVVLFCLLQLFPIKAEVSPGLERRLNPVIGAGAGLMGGISNFFGPPLIGYLIALRLPKDTFVAAIALFFLVGGLPLYGSLAVHRILTADVLLASAIAAIIVLAGVSFGAVVRRYVRQELFERVLLFLLFLIGLNLVRRGLVV